MMESNRDEQVKGEQELTKRELKHVLGQLGASCVGNRAVLLQRLKDIVFGHSHHHDRRLGMKKSFGDPVLYDVDRGEPIDLQNYRQEAKIILEDEVDADGVVELSEKYRGCELIGSVNEKQGSSKPFVVKCDRIYVHEGIDKRRKLSSSYDDQTGLDDDFVKTKMLGSNGVKVIYGRSGSGKTRCLKSWFGNADMDVEWDRNKAIISQFGPGEEDGVQWLLAVGLTSIPSWCKPYHILSTGEKYRARMAKLLQRCASSKGCCFHMDDFTSHLDRTTAKACSNALGRQIRKLHLNCVVATSNKDVLPFLQPDLVVSLGNHEILDITERSQDSPLIHPEVKIWCNQSVIACESWEPKPLSLLDHALENELRTTFRFNQEDEAQPTKGTVLSTAIEKDHATEMCNRLFDKAFDGQCALHIHVPFLEQQTKKDTSFGMITGFSGSSKSLLLGLYFGQPTLVEWDDQSCILEHFQDDQLLKLVYFPEHGLGKSFQQLSSGEKEMANLARLLHVSTENDIFVDEFTSCLDRETAIQVATNVGKFLRENRKKRVVFVSCYSDILGAMNPDWVYDTTMGVINSSSNYNKSTESMKESPVQFDLELEPCEPWVWMFFRDHHYKTSSLSTKARTFILRTRCDSRHFVGFISTIPQVGKNFDQDQFQDTWRAHRTVILPPWQGLGIGSRLSDACAEIHRLRKSYYLAQTVHPKFGSYRDRSTLWTANKHNHTIQEFKIENWRQRLANVRIKLRVPRFIYSHIYRGPHDEKSQRLLDARFQLY